MSQQGKVALPGFRRGKVPLSMLRQRYGKETLYEVLRQECEPLFAEELQRTQERAATPPRLHLPTLVGADGNYKVECEYEVVPPVEAPVFTGKELKKPVFNVDDAAVEEMIEILRRQRGTYHIVDEAAQGEDDRLRADFVTHLLAADGKSEEEELESGTDRILPLSDPNLHADLRAAVQGAKAGETRQAVLTLPPTHPNEAMRGRQVQMTLMIKEVQRLSKAELNEAFFAAFIGADKTLEDFRAEVRTHLQRESTTRLRNILHARAMSMLIECTPPFPLPQTMVAAECHRLMHEAQEQWRQRGMAESIAGMQPGMFLPEGERRVSLGLILSAWQQREQPEIGKESIDARVEEVTQAFEDPAAAAAQLRANPREMEAMYLSVLEDRVTEWVCAQCTTAEEAMSLQAFFHEGGGFV